jgi:hypothetical protein
VTTGLVVIAGEITTDARIDYGRVARDLIRDIGYTRAKFGFDSETCSVLSTIDRQSPDTAMGVDTGGAGDQGLMFGFACNETPELMPLSLSNWPICWLSGCQTCLSPGWANRRGTTIGLIPQKVCRMEQGMGASTVRWTK